ncbi:hypothetical protein [Mesorhizobium sp. AR10]|uniref:hypothetical protein n=1 Tax=Mesorhizobium sp. AR10 TaxID=2865839 RepID=UPI00215F0A9B|nr:hypothetical protein [Mesorhizobium sp. AR10]
MAKATEKRGISGAEISEDNGSVYEDILDAIVSLPRPRLWRADGRRARSTFAARKTFAMPRCRNFASKADRTNKFVLYR